MERLTGGNRGNLGHQFSLEVPHPNRLSETDREIKNTTADNISHLVDFKGLNEVIYSKKIRFMLIAVVFRIIVRSFVLYNKPDL